MDWIFDNFVIIAIVGSAIARWLISSKSKERPPSAGEAPRNRKTDIETLERTKRLREDIRRKRAEREGRPPPLSPADQSPAGLPEPPEMEPGVPPQMPPVLRELMGIPEPESVAPVPPVVPEVNPVLERQRRMEEEMREMEAKRREALALAARHRRANPKRRHVGPRTGELSERDFLATLRDPRQARRAIVLRELLGKPVGLR